MILMDARAPGGPLMDPPTKILQTPCKHYNFGAIKSCAYLFIQFLISFNSSFTRWGIICYWCDTSTAKSSHIALFPYGRTNNVLIVELHALRVTLLSPTLLQHWKSNSLLDDDNCCYNWSTLVRSSSSWYWWWLVKMVTDRPACGEQSQGSEVSFCHFERRPASDEITAWPTPSHHIWCVMYLIFHILH